MASDLDQALTVSASGMDAQSARLRVIAQNIANQDTTGSTPGADAYRRKMVTFGNELDKVSGTSKVYVKSIEADTSNLPLKYDPSNPAANGAGYVKTPNVNSFVEMMDMREAEQNYNANLATMQTARSMLNRTLDILK
jgi:flagellar basal-body rod protein FlgC